MTTQAYKQLEYFDRETGDDITGIVGIVYKLPNGQWQAEVHGGWYVRQGKTKPAAIKAVIKAMKEEDKGMW